MTRVLFDKGELRLYFGHILQLLVPSHRPQLPDTYGIAPGDLSDWSDSDADFMIEEGRRHLDRLYGTFEQIRTRGQIVFTTVLAALVVAAGRLPSFEGRHVALFLVWYLGMALLVVGLIGAAAVFAATAEVGSVDAVILSRMSGSEHVVRSVAAIYPEAVKQTANAVNIRFTILRDSVWFATAGFLVEVVAWVVATGTG